MKVLVITLLFFILSTEIYSESNAVDCNVPQEGDAASVCDQHRKDDN